MQTFKSDQQSCPNPDIIAGRLISMRNIYLRQELRSISEQIQKHYQERLPALHLVSLAAYEQVFYRRPLSLPEELRRDAVKYGIKYYEINIDRLRLAEAENGLCPPHDRLSCFDKKCPLHQTIQRSQIDTSDQLKKEKHSRKKSSNRSRRSKKRRERSRKKKYD